MMGFYGDSWGGGQWLAMSAMMVLFWALLVALVVWAVRSSRGGTTSSVESALTGPDDVLADRYARGEIDEEEFLRRREILHNLSGPAT